MKVISHFLLRFPAYERVYITTDVSGLRTVKEIKLMGILLVLHSLNRYPGQSFLNLHQGKYVLETNKVGN